ncbi:Tyrosine-protein phosphatase non-receptor type 4 [Portunus trituberculatus]|uniref:Tyrosine-protein phosphatase non-receptor type 4 n=1 Tax=Portunus trituberculatus TaxID=210409 RepID=A0A5B7HM83_PORTR|nr:Tyrosine-protein phosphatase non-receptor type 4 [Portunus trituberculatus]
MKPDEGGKFGFNVKGGADQNLPVLVSRVAPNTPADRCYPRLNEGDQVSTRQTGTHRPRAPQPHTGKHRYSTDIIHETGNYKGATQVPGNTKEMMGRCNTRPGESRYLTSPGHFIKVRSSSDHAPGLYNHEITK